jgi:hypothetical protein
MDKYKNRNRYYGLSRRTFYRRVRRSNDQNPRQPGDESEVDGTTSGSSLERVEMDAVVQGSCICFRI